MSTNIVLPTLTEWVKNHVTAFIQAKNQADLESAVDAFLSKNATIVVNGATLSQGDFVNQLSGENFLEQGATVVFSDAVAVPTTDGDNFTAGSVGVFYKAIISESILVLGAPVSKEVTASLNVAIAQDSSITNPNPTGVHGFFDPRRVMSLNEVRLQGAVTDPNLGQA